MLIFLLLSTCFQSSFKLSAFMSKCVQLYLISLVRESSFNMTRGGGEGEDIQGGLGKFLDTRKGGSEIIRWRGGGWRKFVHFKTNRKGAPKN